MGLVEVQLPDHQVVQLAMVVVVPPNLSLLVATEHLLVVMGRLEVVMERLEVAMVPPGVAMVPPEVAMGLQVVAMVEAMDNANIC